MLDRWRNRTTREPELRADLLLLLDYTNYRGERSVRRVIPQRVWYGTTPWHPDEGWLLEAYDVDKQAQRDFALCSIHSMQPQTEESGADVSDGRRDQSATGRVRVRQ